MKIAIASGKGGTGKTTLAVNLAAFLAERYPVVLCDLDVEEPDTALFLKPKITETETAYRYTPQWNEVNCTLCGECQKNCNFNAIIQLSDQIMVFDGLCHSCYACSELCPTNALPMVQSPMGVISQGNYHTLKFMEARLNVGIEQAVPLINKAHKSIDAIAANYRFLLFDCPPGTSCPMIHAISETDYVILVTEPTPFGLHDLKLAVETVQQLGKKTGIVINRADASNAIITDYCASAQVQIIGTIANEREIAEQYSTGALIYKNNAAFEAQLERITAHLMENEKGDKG